MTSAVFSQCISSHVLQLTAKLSPVTEYGGWVDLNITSTGTNSPEATFGLCRPFPCLYAVSE